MLNFVCYIMLRSWKFPQQAAVDLDIEQLLQRYIYRPAINPESNQIVHIVLLELVIDR